MNDENENMHFMYLCTVIASIRYVCSIQYSHPLYLSKRTQRLAMLAAAGWPLSELFDKKLASALHLTPFVDDANRAPALLNGGLGKVSPAYWAAVLLLASAVDAYGLTKVNDKDYTPGDLKFDPLGLKKINPQWMETAEIKNGRLAMIAITGFAVQEFVSGNAAFAAL